jgi:hypothetical protein
LEEGGLEVNSQRLAVLGALATTVLAVTATGCSSRTPEQPGGSKYERAVTRMVKVNHLLEKRQTELFYLAQRGPRASLLADLHREVENLERDYEDAILAMEQANR